MITIDEVRQALAEAGFEAPDAEVTRFADDETQNAFVAVVCPNTALAKDAHGSLYSKGFYVTELGRISGGKLAFEVFYGCGCECDC